jgi:hypothetical protein
MLASRPASTCCFLGPAMTPWPSPSSPCTCPTFPLHAPPVRPRYRCCPCRSPQAPPPKVCACAPAHRPAPGVVGWLSHEVRPQHYSLALHREGGGGQPLQQALVMAPRRGVIHSGFLAHSESCIPLPPLWVSGSVGPCMWACMRTRDMGCVVRREGGRSSL